MNVEKVMNGSQPSQNNDLSRERASTMNGPAVQVKQEKSSEADDAEVINTKQVETIVSQMNGFLEPARTNLKFVFHEQLNEYYVEVVNPLTDEVVKEIPPKKMLDMYASMTEFMGILIDEKI